MLQADRHRLVLWSCRQGRLLDDALDWCRERGLEFYAVNSDYPEETFENNPYFTRKIKADLFIDDRNLGGLPDWGVIYQMVTKKTSWREMVNANEMLDNSDRLHRPWWQFWKK